MKNILFWSVDIQQDFIMQPNYDEKNIYNEASVGHLYIKDAELIIPNVIKLLSFLIHDFKYKTIFTMDYHTAVDKEISLNYPDFINTYPPHCMGGTQGVLWVEKTSPYDYIEGKNIIEMFGGENIFRVIQKYKNNNDTIVMKSYPTTNTDEINYMDSLDHINASFQAIIQNTQAIILGKNEFNVFTGNLLANEILKIINPEINIVFGVAAEICVNYLVKELIEKNYKTIVVKDAVKALPNFNIHKLFEEWRKMGVTLLNTNQIIETFSE